MGFDSGIAIADPTHRSVHMPETFLNAHLGHDLKLLVRPVAGVRRGVEVVHEHSVGRISELIIAVIPHSDIDVQRGVARYIRNEEVPTDVDDSIGRSIPTHVPARVVIVIACRDLHPTRPGRYCTSHFVPSL